MSGNSAQLGLHLLNSISQKAKEFNNIKQTKIENQMEQEKWKLEKQKIEADIKYKQARGELSSAQALNLQAMVKEKNKIKEGQFKITKIATEDAHYNNVKVGKSLGMALQELNKQIENNLTLTDATYNTDKFGNISKTERFKSPSNKLGSANVTKEEQILGELQTGERYDRTREQYMPFESREEMEKHAARKLGYKWEENFPQAQKIINEKFPPPRPQEQMDLTKGVKAGLEVGTKDIVKKVRVISPDGVPGYIPESKLEEAKKRGFKVEQ